MSNQGFYYDLIIWNSNLTLDRINDIGWKVDSIEAMWDAIRSKVYKL